MISKISLYNFQSHPESELELHPGINSIIGSSDQGKSAVLRALYWAVYNRPSGSAFVSYWAKDEKGKQTGETEVSIVKYGKTLSRFRSPDANGYRIDNVQLDAIGTDVPEQVKKFFDLTEVNIQKQMDAPFLISDSAGAIARFFNSIIKLDSIDTALSSIDRKKRDNKINLTNAEAKAENIETALKRFDWIPDAEELVNKAEKYNHNIEKKRKEYENIESDLVSADNQRKIVEKANKTLAAERFIDELVELKEKGAELGRVYTDLDYTIKSYNSREKEIQENAGLIRIANEGLIEKAESLNSKITEREKGNEMLKASMVNYIQLSEKITDQESIIEQTKAELPDVCPTCGRPMED